MTSQPRVGQVKFAHKQYKDLCDRQPDTEDEFDFLAEAASKSGGTGSVRNFVGGFNRWLLRRLGGWR